MTLDANRCILSLRLHHRSVGNTEGMPLGTGNGADGDYRPRSGFRGGRGAYRGAGMGRGGGRGRGGVQDTRGKREFDRLSGSDKSGVKPVEKREGSGAHNWGSVQDEIEGQLEPAIAEEVPEGEGESPAEGEARYVCFLFSIFSRHVVN